MCSIEFDETLTVNWCFALYTEHLESAIIDEASNTYFLGGDIKLGHSYYNQFIVKGDLTTGDIDWTRGWISDYSIYK